ncbi:MAG: lipid A biosynthesis acyltransferase, partial [Pirellulales bacterium]
MQLADMVDPLDDDFCLGTVPLLTAWYTKCLENLIRQSPEQYWWVHRRWKGRPQNRHAIRRWKREQQAA